MPPFARRAFFRLCLSAFLLLPSSFLCGQGEVRTLKALQDVQFISPATGQTLALNSGGKWANTAPLSFTAPLVNTTGTITITLASQAEAEAGAINTKAMTPLRVAQAIAALAGAGGYDPAAVAISGGTIKDTILGNGTGMYGAGAQTIKAAPYNGGTEQLLDLVSNSGTTFAEFFKTPAGYLSLAKDASSNNNSTCVVIEQNYNPSTPVIRGARQQGEVGIGITFGDIGYETTVTGVSGLSIPNVASEPAAPTAAAQIYAFGGEMKVQDASGNKTVISPHSKFAPPDLW